MKKLILFLILACLFFGACSSTESPEGVGNGDGLEGEEGNDGGDGGNDDSDDGTSSAMIADHSVIASFDSIPTEYIDQATSSFKIYYGHTSHGSQIITGLEMLDSSEFDYDAINIEEESGDLGHNGDTAWADTTRARLDLPGSDINTVMWSWCGGVQDNTEGGIDTYLNTMADLEEEYPDVTFIYMTGHLSDDPSLQSNLLARNEQIKDFCRENNKALFDFADIESYDPDGTQHTGASDTDACGWCSDWCSSHTCPSCSDCAHSHLTLIRQ